MSYMQNFTVCVYHNEVLSVPDMTSSLPWRYIQLGIVFAVKEKLHIGSFHLVVEYYAFLRMSCAAA